MKQFLIETEATSREDFLAAAIKAWEEDVEAVRMAQRTVALDVVVKDVKEYLNLYWEDEAFIEFSAEVFRAALLTLVDGDGVKDVGSGVGVGHHTPTKSIKSTKNAKCSEVIKDTPNTTKSKNNYSIKNTDSINLPARITTNAAPKTDTPLHSNPKTIAKTLDEVIKNQIYTDIKTPKTTEDKINEFLLSALYKIPPNPLKDSINKNCL